jgi:Uma2 family endonuclease
VVVLKSREGYFRKLPGPEDVLLLIEVSDTSLSYDRNVKLPLYARAGIPEVWIVDLASETIERHTEPTAEGYRLVRRTRRGETLRSEGLGALVLPVDAVLG